MKQEMSFSNRNEFRNWLEKNHESADGFYMIFGKKGGPKTLTAHEALEEALCYGWIDGVIISIDETKYKKYFARRVGKSNWSIKNKKLVEDLIARNIMTKAGFEAIENAKKNGMWDIRKETLEIDQIEGFMKLVKAHKTAYHNLSAMSYSVQKNYAGFYYEAKSEETKKRRLEKIIERLNNNLKPM